MLRRTAPALSLVSILTAGGIVALQPADVEACGGTFCDTGPQAMPVDQTGENIIFKLDGTSVEAHIQIQYDPTSEAAKFAWVIPMQTLPSFSVGSDLLFTNTLNATVPTYGLTDQFDDCSSTGESFSSGAGSATMGTTAGDGGGEGGDNGGPNVVYEETVGAFDIVVLEGGTVTEVMAWLAAEGYEQDPAAEPILDEYVQEGFLFAAIKLTNSATVSEIHPIVLRYEGTEPCVPLRLTRIAAVDDMDVRVFFYGNERVIPTNYRHVEVNPLKIDWVNLAANYKDVITLAVDADGADGNAFVTEFAGAHGVFTGDLWSSSWEAAPFAAMTTDPNGVVDVLESQGLVDCSESQGWGDGDGDGDLCRFNHPLVEGLLAQYVPVPPGLAQREFYDCISCFPNEVDLAAWDAQAFADTMQSRVIDPGLAAYDLVLDNPYVTRMYTTISDYEMNEDPVFAANSELPEITNQRTATRQNHCDGTAHMTLPDGREVYMPSASAWPEISPDEMPWEEHIDRAVPTGPMLSQVDQTETIDALLADWNGQADPDGAGPAGCSCTTGSGGAGLGMLACIGLVSASRRRRRRR
jgi:hypothetical protein